ncbi:hypothetical protein HF670_00040, partial [Acidithiobacillus thiooxidans]|uniref:hypothetical protein n=1 Tax=Acidithiobacillus thiooxidans TaxID=930 RepID=UPI001C07DEA3
ERVAAGNGGTDSRQSGTHGENGASLGSGLGYPEGDHGAIDTDSSGIHPERDADAFARQGEAVSDDGEGATQESDGIQSGVEALDARSKGFTGGDSKDTAAVLDSVRVNGDTRRDRDRDRDSADADATVKPSWNSRFRGTSAAEKRAKEQKRSPIKKVDYAQVRDAAHFADLVSYMESIGLPVKKDGVKDWVVDDRYRVTKKPDGHFVWCDWNAVDGGDPIYFCQNELGMTHQQAIADLSGSRITKNETKKFLISHIEPISTPPQSKDRDAITAYLESRGISKTTVGLAHGKGFLRFVDYKGIPAAAFCGLGDGALRSVTIRLTQPIKSFDGEKELTKLDVRHSDKSYPALWRGDNPSTVWIVEGGIDALAAVEWHRAYRKPIPTIIVSGGAVVRSFLNQPHVQEILKETDTVYVAMEHEKDQETQAKTDAAHEKQIDKLCDLGCEKVIAWMPPDGSKDLADAWKAGLLPDPYDGSHNQSENSDDVLMLPNEAVEAVEAMAPVMRDD